MTDLISRLSTSEPTRELADEVLRLYGWTSAGGGWRNPGKQWSPFRPNPLTNLNAAVTLVPEGLPIQLDMRAAVGKPSFACIGEILDGEVYYPTDNITWAATPAIALTIACLRAKEMNDDR